jgi:hypothetical protein
MKKKLLLLLLMLFTSTFLLAQTPTPTDGATGVPINPTFSFTNYDSGNVPYTFQLGIVAGNSNIFTRTDVTANEAANGFTTGLTLNYNTQYEWWVRSTAGPWYPNGGAIPGYRFTTLVLPSPTLTAPANTISGVSILPYFDWTWSGSGAVTYDLAITNGTQTITRTGITATDYQLSENDVATSTTSVKYLTNNSNYTWTVTVRQGTNSTPSTTSSFKTTVSAVASLSNPGSGSTVYTYAPVLFSWTLSQAVGSLTFKLQYVKNSASGGTPDATDWANGAITTTVDCSSDLFRNTESLTPGTKYWWRVITYRGTEVVSYSSQQWFTTAGGATAAAAIPSWPIGGATVYTNAPTLYWYTNVADLTGITFDVIISKNSNLSSPIALTDAAGLTNLYYDVSPDLSPGTLYYWEVVTHGTGDVSSTTSATKSFKTNGTGTVVQPIASYPSSGVTVYTQSPTFYWYLSSATSGITYKVYIDGSLNGTTGVDEYSFTTSSTLTPGSHTWYVQATNGTSAQDQSSSTITFTVAGGITQGLPIASWPVGNPTVYTTTPTLYWYVSGSTLGITTYTVKVTTTTPTNNTTFWNNLGGGWDVGLVQNYTLPNPLLYGTTYYWAVASWDGANYSVWSSGKFTIAGTTGSIVPVVSYPKGGVTIYSTSATLSWYVNGSTTGIDHYRVVYSRRSDMDETDGTNTFTATPTDQYLAVTGLVPGATYYWKVASHNGTSLSAYSSPTATFVVALTASASVIVPLVGSPINGVGITTASPVLSWVIPTQASTPLSYELQYSKQQDMSNPTTVSGIKSPSQIVSGLASSQEYYWRVRSVNDKGQSSAYSEVGKFIVSSVTAIEEKDVIPTSFELSQNYPNPFNPTTRIRYALPQNAFVSIKIYDMLGREIRSLINNEMVAGNHSVEWSGDDNSGNRVSSGAYIYRITATAQAGQAGNPSAGSGQGFISTKKMIMLK